MKSLTVLQPVLTLLADNIDILPAVGGAVEDLLRPDVEEMEDMLINKDSREVTDFLETPRPDIRNIYRPTPPLYRPQKHLYQYFRVIVIFGELERSHGASRYHGR